MELDPNVATFGLGSGGRDRVLEQGYQSRGFGRDASRCVASGEEQEIVGEVRESSHLVGRVLDGVVELRGSALWSSCELELRLEHRERCAQLVARIRDKRPLSFERSVQPAEQRVHRRR